MARGWGRDEEDIDEPATHAAEPDKRSAAERRAEQERARKIQSLELQRERILSEKTSNPARRAALQAALEQVEAELQSSIES